jgi:hypothetical protein
MITLMASVVVNRRNVSFEIATLRERFATNGTRITNSLVSGFDMPFEITPSSKQLSTIIERTHESSLVTVNGLNV